MAIQARKLIRNGDSVALPLSDEFLESIGATKTDVVYVDEAKLQAAFVSNEQTDTLDKQIEQLAAQSIKKYRGAYRKMADL